MAPTATRFLKSSQKETPFPLGERGVINISPGTCLSCGTCVGPTHLSMPYGVWAVLHRKFSAPWPFKNSSLCFANRRSVPRNRVQVPSVFSQVWAHAPDIPRGAWSQSFGSQSTHVPSFSQVPQIYAAIPPGLYIHPLYLFHFRSVTVFRFVTYIK